MNYKANSKIKKRASVKKEDRKKFFKGLFTTLIFVLILVAIIWGGKIVISYFVKHPNFHIKKIEVVNNEIVSAPEIQELGQITQGLNIYTTSTDLIKKRIERNPDIESVTVTKIMPGTLKIEVFEREPVALLLSANKKLKIPVDKNGVMLSARVIKLCKKLPKIYGACLTNTYRGNVVSDELVPLATSYLDEVNILPSQDYLTISEIEIAKPQGIIFKTTTIDKIILGNDYSNKRIDRLMKILKQGRLHRMNIKEIDLRFDDVPVITKTL